ncbi:MAG: helix-turn-helix transcriptional regulator [Rhizobacter sp.]|nr:helix-turn-helix transcriptional regulator [Ferruginibacter sp.]
MIIDLHKTIQEHPEYFRQLKCGNLLFTQYDCPQEAINQRLFSDCNYIAYVLSGKRIFHLPGEKHIMTEGKCVFAKKGGWIAEKEPAEGWCVLVFFIPDEYLKSFITEYRPNLPIKKAGSLPNEQMIDLDINTTSQSFFYSMLPYFVQDPPPPDSLVELKFRELLFNLLINPLNEGLLSWLCYTADCQKQPLPNVMEANYTYNLSLADYAKIAGRSIASFKREFSTLYKTSPGKWLLQKRLEYAGMLLNNSARPVNEIAFESGFENITHFNRVFKQKFGASPLQFRQQTSGQTI